MSTPKLTYFNGRGLAEIIRLIFTAADKPFIDHRIDQEEFKKLKPSLPFGQIPILEVDGKTMFQSRAIARYLARKYDLAGKTDLEQAQADMIVDCIEDALKPVPAFRNEPDPAKKEAMKKDYLEKQLPDYLSKLEAFLISNKGGDGYFVGDGLTWADLSLQRMKGSIEILIGVSAPFDNHPKLKALFERVTKLPKIAAYLAKLPDTPF